LDVYYLAHTSPAREGGGVMRKEEWEILTDKVDTYDETGFPDEKGEYDANGFPLPITKG
jgi:hypothetical protein